jgi:hypothetical protein
MLAFAVAAQSYKPLYDIIENLSKNKKFVGAIIGGSSPASPSRPSTRTVRTRRTTTLARTAI